MTTLFWEKRNTEAIIEARQNLYEYKRELTDLAKQYAETETANLIQDMIDKYTSDIEPETEKLRNFKYALSTIECSDGGEYMGGCDDDTKSFSTRTIYISRNSNFSQRRASCNF